jgi:hypothetical protein
MKEEYKTFVKAMMRFYDLATELAPKEGKSHRETFDLICQYLALECEIGESRKLLEETEKRIQQLNVDIKDRKGTLAILKAIEEGKIGRG